MVTKKAAERAPRQTKTSAQRAQERVDSLQRQYDRTVAKHKTLTVEIKALEDEGGALMRRLTYAKQDPDLQAALTAEDKAARDE